MSFASDIARFAENAGRSIDETSRAVALELFGSIIKDTPKDTGRAQGNWQTSIGTSKDSEIGRTGESGAVSEMTQEVAKFGAGKVMYLSNNLPYIYRLEYLGWSEQAKGGMVRVNVARIQQIVAEQARRNRV